MFDSLEEELQHALENIKVLNAYISELEQRLEEHDLEFLAKRELQRINAERNKITRKVLMQIKQGEN